MKRLMVLAMLIGGCGVDDGGTANDRSCDEFDGRVTFAQPLQWCRLSLSGEDGGGGVYKTDILDFGHVVYPIAPKDANGSELDAGGFKGTDGFWYTRVELWPDSATLGVALRTGPENDQGITDGCAWFVCDAALPDMPIPEEAPHPW